jgi:DNA integrity scanning protein DisA with diadenylate cyclase activity
LSRKLLKFQRFGRTAFLRATARWGNFSESESCTDNPPCASGGDRVTARKSDLPSSNRKKPTRMKEANRLLEAACTIAQKYEANAILVYADVIQDYRNFAKMAQEAKTELIAVARDEMTHAEASQYIKKLVMVPRIELGRLNQIKIGIIRAMSAGLINEGEKLVCLSGTPKSSSLDTLIILDLGKEIEMISTASLPVVSEIVKPEVFDALLTTALELAIEGREGKPVGAIFVAGDQAEVLKFSHQMVINPFKGYPEEERFILDPRLKNTIKEFSSIDGAFVIRDDGVILAAGRHLDASGETIEIPQGLGSRHRAAAGITNVSKAIAVVISESTGEVRLFSRGRIFMEIEKGE